MPSKSSCDWTFVFVYEWTGTKFARVAYCRLDNAVEVSKLRWEAKEWISDEFYFGGWPWIDAQAVVNKKRAKRSVQSTASQHHLPSCFGDAVAINGRRAAII